MTLPDRIPVLDHGFVELVGVNYDFTDLASVEPGDDWVSGHIPATYRLPDTLDAMIARAARTSYAGGTKKVSDDDRLIDRLMRDQHTSPFEQVSFKFLVKAPLFVVQQMLRHRTAKLNQESARYSVISDEMHVPEQLRRQSATNKQMSDGDFPYAENQEMRQHVTRAYEGSYAAYEALITAGVAREQARFVLPHGTFTTLVWQMDLHNLLHFLRLRLAPHAQPEIQEYARAMLVLVETLVPVTVKHWRNHLLGGERFSEDEMDVVRDLIEDGLLYRHEAPAPSYSADFEEKHQQALVSLTAELLDMGIPKHRVVEFAHKIGYPITAEHVKQARDAARS